MERFEKFLMYAEAAKLRHILGNVFFALEPTANYHKPLAEYLIKQDQMVVLVGGEAIKKDRVLPHGRWDSNDMKDAANVAYLVSQGKYLYYDYPCLLLKELRGPLSLKRRLKKK